MNDSDDRYSRWKKLNLLYPAKFPSYREFVAKWTEANQEQAEGRFKRDDDEVVTVSFPGVDFDDE